LADVKMTVAGLIARDGLLVLNADDGLLRAKAGHIDARFGWSPPLGWFALDYDHPLLVANRTAGAPTSGVRAGRLILSYAGSECDLGPVAEMPLTVLGAATYNVANLAGAALAAAALGIAPATIAGVFAVFGADPNDNPGRLMRFMFEGAHVLLDYAHNPDGLHGVLSVARSLRAPGGRIAVLLGHAGNRRDEDLEAVAATAASFAPDFVVVKESEHHLRGRPSGEIPALLRAALLKHGVDESVLALEMTEVAAARRALDWARPGDVVALLVHSAEARADVLGMLHPRGA
jgi:UDP-N-acetylmuramyl tripeptide synthase